MESNVIYFDGPCPFLFCMETEAHDHPICPNCGAVRYGNLDCPICQTEGKAYREKELAQMKELRPSLFRAGT